MVDLLVQLFLSAAAFSGLWCLSVSLAQVTWCFLSSSCKYCSLHTSTDNTLHFTVISGTNYSHIYLLFGGANDSSSAFMPAPPPVSEPTAAQCQSGCALLSICLKRHHYNQEHFWFSHFGFCHVTLWILIGMESSRPLRDCRNTFHAFYTSGRVAVQISPQIKRI